MKTIKLRLTSAQAIDCYLVLARFSAFVIIATVMVMIAKVTTG